MTEDVLLGDPLQYMGAFYPTEQLSPDSEKTPDSAKWRACVNWLNIALACPKNWQNETFTEICANYKNRYGSHIAPMWDVCYAWYKVFKDYNENINEVTESRICAETYNAMLILQQKIEAMNISEDEKYQLWRQMNVGGFVCDEPVANRYGRQNSLSQIYKKIMAIQYAFSQFTDPWWLPQPKVMIALHRQGNSGPWVQNGGDSYLEDIMKALGVDLWGMDTYIQTDETEAMIWTDRNYFYDTLTSQGIESPGSKFMVMIGRAFSELDGYPGWLSCPQTKWYYDCATEWDDTRGFYWYTRFHSLFWWVYYLENQETNSKKGYSHPDGETVEQCIHTMSEDNFT
ncbi:MAG: hypothetical protein ACTSVD_10020 [Candidatus Thorarchaeota archaeon]